MTALLSISSIENIYVDGYFNRKPERILVSKVPGLDKTGSSIWINIKAKQDLLDMVEHAAKDGVYLKINYAFRDYSLQKRLKRRNPRIAAKPGRSSHQEATSIDISGVKNKTSTYFWLKEYASKYSFYQPMRKEPWHWSWHEKEIQAKQINKESLDSSP